VNIRTSKRIELVDITKEVKSEVHKSGIDNGICVVSTSHTTTAIILNENETGLRHDILDFLEKLVPPSVGYQHDRIDNNADAHLKAVILGSSETIPVTGGELVLGTWQRIFFVELDGPRQRTVNITKIKKGQS
jgi:secondary thiamine-phosphate synthase enzyme